MIGTNYDYYMTGLSHASPIDRICTQLSIDNLDENYLCDNQVDAFVTGNTRDISWAL